MTARAVRAGALSLALLASLVAQGAAGAAAPAARRAAPTASAAARPPRFAYYYIWFSKSSWNRAKTDLPLLGPYDSGDASVIRQHITWAKDAGLDGFIVSWKHTPILDARLEKVVEAAEAEHFGLAIIYQGLDFNRRPQPIGRISADLAYFRDRFAARAPFRVFPKPLVVWSGTWKYRPAEVASVTSKARGALRILASEKSVKGYERLADLVDGDAYYWSSINPDPNGRSQAKLAQMSAAVHADHGLWIAPAAVGFDARELGGTRVINRKNGTTYRQSLDGALGSSPDIVGVISWNEFSENSHLEPSERYGTCYLDIVARTAGLAAPDPGRCTKSDAAGTGSANVTGQDRSDSSSQGSGAPYGPLVLGGFGLFIVGAVAVGARRRLRLVRAVNH